MPEVTIALPTQERRIHRCLLPVDEGFIPIAEAPRNRFFFDKSTSSCTPFLYYGNPPEDANNFATLEECVQLCGGKGAYGLPTLRRYL